MYLIQLGRLGGLPWEQAVKEEADGLSNKDVQFTSLAWYDSTSLVSQVSRSSKRMSSDQEQIFISVSGEAA